VLQEGGVGIHVERLAFVGLVPVVDLGLQGVAGREQFAGLRRQILDDAGEPAQKASGAMPVPAVASLAIKSDRTGAIFKPLASIRVMINLTENGEKARRSGASG
jgi:hypothetical protein